MAKLIQLSNISWRQPFADRGKELLLWSSQKDVAQFCGFKDGTKRVLNIKFEDQFAIDVTDSFQITSGKQISFPKQLIDRVRKVVFENPDSYFNVTVTDTLDSYFTPSNIRWIKNVKHKQGEGWAYQDVNYAKPFFLHWPTSKPNSAKTPKVGDIILIFQKPNEINGKRNRKVHLTHLVSPISETIYQDETSPKHKWCREVALVAMADPIDAIPNPGYLDFFLPNRGLTNPIANLKNKIGLNEIETNEDVWDLFQEYFHPIYTCRSSPFGNPAEEVLGEVEGDKVVREHIRQELSRRNSAIVARAKNEAISKGNGRVLCECCDFDFVKVYGNHGTHFIECHHKKPISEGQRITTIGDLALVCSNCHRMLHRKNGFGGYYSITDLRKLISEIKTEATQ